MTQHLFARHHFCISTLMTALLALPVAAQATSTPDRTGKEVVEATCIVCHGPGKDGAPRFGHSEEWSKRASQGINTLTSHAITGIRKMPAHGGEGSLSDLEISRAISYMVSGGKAPDPKTAYSSPQQWTGEQIVKARCGECHSTGKGGAPHIGNMEEWSPRLKSGVENLVKSSIRGHNAMPSRGGLSNLSDADMRAAITYMVTPSNAAK
ncbi:MAG: c-type cytochrome [Sulfuricella sp.]